MPRESKQYKANYFDLRIEGLKKHYSKKSPKGAYGRIKTFMLANGFEHAQYSGYHSKKRMMDLEVIDMIEKMRDALPWLGKSANHFEVTNIGANSDLMHVFVDVLEDPLL